MDNDSIELVKEYADSMEISSNAKGEYSYKIKVYGDAKTIEGRQQLETDVKDLESKAKAIINKR